MRSATLDFLRRGGSCVFGLKSAMLQKVQDTRRIAGRDLYSGCLDIYQSLQRYGGTEDVDATLAQLGKRFPHGPRRAKDGDAAPAQK